MQSKQTPDYNGVNYSSSESGSARLGHHIIRGTVCLAELLLHGCRNQKLAPTLSQDLEAWIIARCNYRPNGADIEIEVRVWETTGG
jgi:hypothetical protein